MKDVRDQVAKKRKVALYASMDMGDYYPVLEVSYVDYDEHLNPLPAGQLREYPKQGYVRISEPIELSFSPISNDEIVAKAVESLNEEERKAIDELNRKIAAIREKKSQLLALTHQVEGQS
jgi:hypothetical protein